MTAPELTCAQVDEQDFDLRYLTGKLSDLERESFEAHYFSCPRCWALVEQGANLRAARPAEAPVVRAFPRPRPRRGWVMLALAAGVAAVAFGLWQRAPRTPADELRGDADTLALRLAPMSNALQVSWPPAGGATRYRVRLYLPDGTLLFQRETGDTIFAFPRDSLQTGSSEPDLFWLVEALSPTGLVLARSGLVAQSLPLPVP